LVAETETRSAFIVFLVISTVNSQRQLGRHERAFKTMARKQRQRHMKR